MKVGAFYHLNSLDLSDKIASVLILDRVVRCIILQKNVWLFVQY